MSEQHILIVDDETEFLDSLAEGLAPYRDTFRVLTARDGRQALEILESHPVDLVVTDLKMPGMDGFQLLSHLRVHHPSAPIIVLSAFVSTEVARRLKRIGVSHVLDKPVEFDVLIAAILKGLARPEPSGGLAGISMSGFMQLIEVEKKSCILVASSKAGERGIFIFHEGQLMDAQCNGMHGEEAAYHMLGWDNPTLNFETRTKGQVARRITAPLMSILLEGARRKDEALENAARGVGELSQTHDGPDNEGAVPAASQTEPESTGKHELDTEQQRRPTMAGLKPILKEMADEMDGVIALAVVGMDGILVAAHNPTGAEVEVLSAKFAMLLKLASRTTEQIKGMGEFEENLVQSQNTWVLSRYLSQNYYLGIAVSRDGTLGNIRLVAQKYTDKLARAL